MSRYPYLPSDEHTCCEVSNKVETSASYEAILMGIVAGMEATVKKLFYPVLFTKIMEDLSQALSSGTGSNHHSPFLNVNERNMVTMMEANLFRFSAAKSVAEVQEINRWFREGLSMAEMKSRVKEMNEQFNKHWLNTEIRTAYGTGLSSSEYIQKSETFPFVRWVQIERATKRISHSLLHGKIYRTKELPGIPPIDWNCGCRIEYLEDHEVRKHDTPENFVQTLKDSKATSGRFANLYDQMKHYGFNRHKAKLGEVFSLNKTYGKTFNVDTLTWKTSGLTSFKSMEISRMTPMVRDSRNIQAVRTMEFRGVHDYANRAIRVDKSVINNTNYRHIHQLRDILAHPDEVYLQKFGNRYKYVYMKFYSDASTRVSLRCEVELSRNGGLQVIAMKKAVNADQYRRGVNVFNSKA